MTLGNWMGAALISAGALGAAFADDEARISPDKLPVPVKAAIKARFPGAELKGASKESEGGETIFEVSLTYKGDKYDLAIEPNGEIEEIERAIFADALPSAVVKAIQAKYPKAEIEEAEEVTDEHGEVCYEVAVTLHGKTREVAVTLHGKIKKDGEAEEDEEGEDHEKKGEKHEDKAKEKGEKHEAKEKGEKHEKEKGEKHEGKEKGEKDDD